MRSSWLSVVLGAVFTIGVQATYLLAFRGVLDVSKAIRLAMLGLGVVVLTISIARRRRWNTKLASLLFVSNAAAYYVVAWIWHANAARSGEPWVPFEAYKAYFIALAVLIPVSYWINVLLMAGFVIEAIIIWTVLDLPHSETAVIQHEPWATLVFIAMAAALLGFRVSHDRVARDLERARSRAEMLEQVARVFLSIRDKANTPLQTLRVTAAIVRERHPESVALADTVSRSTDRIAETSALLSRFDAKVTWPSEDLMTDDEILRLIAKP